MNYFKTAFRYLGRNKLYISIKILGLTLGITCALFAVLYVKDEIDLDDFHQKGKQLYRIALLTVNFQAIKAAVVSPVTCLRTE